MTKLIGMNNPSSAQTALSKVNSITLPTTHVQLILVHDESQLGIGSILYLIGNGLMKIGGFFGAKLKPNQTRWYHATLKH